MNLKEVRQTIISAILNFEFDCEKENCRNNHLLYFLQVIYCHNVDGLCKSRIVSYQFQVTGFIEKRTGQNNGNWLLYGSAVEINLQTPQHKVADNYSASCNMHNSVGIAI